MWFWIGVGVGSFIGLSLLIAFAFARALGALNGEVIELHEDRVPAPSARPASSCSSHGTVENRHR
jgi:hypothetical protein